MKTMNEQDKNKMLDKVLNEGETYSAKVWGTIMAGTDTMLAIGAAGGILTTFAGAAATGLSGTMGALTNEYCYVGMTDSRLIFCVVGKMDCSKVKGYFSIHFDGITKVKVSGSFIPGRKVLKIYIDKKCIKLSLVNNTIGTDIEGQKEGIEKILNRISDYR